MELDAYGEVTVHHGHRDVTTRVRTAGSLAVPAGTWRVRVACSDERGNVSTFRTSEERDGPDRIEVPDVDHIAFRHDQPSTIHTAISLQRHTDGGWRSQADELHTEPLAALPAAEAPPRWSVHLVATEYGESATPRPMWEEDLDAQPDGLSCVRMGLAWHGLQPTTRGVWAEDKARYLDEVFERLDARGFSVALSLGTMPTWAGDAPYGPLDDPAAVGAWVRDVIDRWADVVRIEFVDVWNEPNLKFEGTLGQIGTMVKAAHEAADGDVPVYLSPQSLLSTELLDEIVDGGGVTDDDFDGVDLHPYPISFAPWARWEDPHFPVNDLDRRPGSPLCGIHVVQDWLDDHGFSPKPIAVSEIGVSRYPVGDDPLLRISDERAAGWHGFLLDRLARIEDVVLVSVHEAADAADLVENASWNAAWGLVDEEKVRRGKWDAVAEVLSRHVADPGASSG